MKKTMKPPHIVMSAQELRELSKKLEGQLEKGDYEVVKAILETYLYLHDMVQQKSTSIKKLLRTLFGKTEKAAKLLKKLPESKGKNEDDAGPDVGTSEGGPEQEPKVKGHGRNGYAEYSGARTEKVPHPELKHGDPCPECPKGKVYQVKEPETVIRIKAEPPLQATAYELEKLRCNACGAVFKASLPAEAGNKKYDETAGAMIPIFRYGTGIPFNRLESLQAGLGVPLPASTQWDVAEQAADKIYPAYDELLRQSAAAELLHNDDTPMKVLELMNRADAAQEPDKPARTGIFTTGIIAKLQEHKIALFFTGRNHAGENMAEVLKHRQPGLPPPIQMCDGLSRNLPKAFKTILANCLTHGRRNFVDVYSNFPEQCRYVIEALAEVYKHDALTRQKALSADERLAYHRAHSGPLMEALHQWLDDQLQDKLAEPNSGLGQAIKYMLNHWEALTQFLRVPGAPLDNNICERALKRSILHRKNSLFYKTEHGAYIGDVFMSLIHTCYLSKINPFDYLVNLQKHSSSLFKNPENWLPWNYQQTLAMLEASEI